MFTVTEKTEHGEKWTTYQSWYDVWLEGWRVSLLYLLAGISIFFATPWFALACLWKPFTVASGEKREKSPFESSDNLT